MGANTSNALFYLVSTLFEIYIWIVMLRMMLQLVRADFYNPISQLVWQLTQPIVRPLQTVFPKVGQYDTAAAVVVVAGQRVADQDRVALRGIEGAVGLDHQLVARQRATRVQRQRPLDGDLAGRDLSYGACREGVRH